MRHYVKYLFLSVCLLLMACHAEAATTITSSSPEGQAITAAIVSYTKTNTAVPADQLSVSNILKANKFARASVVPLSGGDSAIVFLQHTEQGWQVLSLGTAFDNQFYQQYNIPKALQLG